jgi:hypothetical protein
MNVNKSLGLPINKQFGRLEGVGHTSLQKDLHVNFDTPSRHKDFSRVHLVVLQHLSIIDPWLSKHKRLSKKVSKKLLERRRS